MTSFRELESTRKKLLDLKFYHYSKLAHCERIISLYDNYISHAQRKWNEHQNIINDCDNELEMINTLLNERDLLDVLK